MPPKTTTTVEVIAGIKCATLTGTKPLIPDGIKRTVKVSPDLFVVRVSLLLVPLAFLSLRR